MNFKNKAGLALALAAIFTAAGANAAVADYDITGAVDSMRQGVAQLTANAGTVGDGIAILNTDDILRGSDGSLGLSMSNYTIALDALDLVGANNVTSLTINNNNQAVNIGAVNIAGNGGALFTSNGKAIESVAVHGALTLGTGGASKSPGGSLVDLLVAYTGLLFSGIPVLNVHGGAFDITGSLSVLDGDVNVGSLFDDFSASLNVHNLKMDDNSTFSVDAGFGSSRGQAAIGSFGDVGSTALADTAINVRLLVTQNGTLTVGLDNSQWIDSVIAALDGTTPFNTWTVDGGLTAAFGLFSPQRLLLRNSGIGIGINALPSADTFVAFDHSLTAINLTDVDANTAAFSIVAGNGASAAFNSVAIGGQTGNTATIYLDNAAAGKDYKIFDNVASNNISIGSNALSGNKVLTDADLGEYWNYNAGTMVFSSGLLEGSWEVVKGDANSDLLLHVTRNNVEVKDIFSTMSGGMASMVDQLYTAGENSNAADNAGIRFVSRATDIMYMPNRAEAAKVLEGAAQIAVAAGAPAVTGNVISKMASVVVNHNDMPGGSQPAYGNRPGQVGLWLTPFYAAGDAKGLKAGNFKNSYEMNYGGAAFGLDYTVSEAFRLGLALSVGGGDTESDGDFNKTTNDFDFFGASLYGAYTLGAFGLTADLGFTGVDGDVKQRVPASMQMGDLKSDTESNAFTFGLIGKYRFTPAENISIAPHLGLRYTKISIDDVAVQAGGGTVFNTTVEDQNLFQIPLGVELSTNILTDSGWKITPKADLGVLFTMGDTDITTRARIAGTNFQTGAMTAEAVDKTAFAGALGIQATADNGLSLGLTYNLQVSPNQTDHQFSGTLRFEF